MESYGVELKETPYPLIAALGPRELQARVLQLLRTINEEHVPKLHFSSLPREHRFPQKKEVREKHGTFPAQTQRDFEGYRIHGLVKTRWLKKHHELVPAVVLLFHEYDPRWPARDWAAQEAAIKEDMDQLRRGLSGRECRVLLILVQQVEDGTPGSGGASGVGSGGGSSSSSGGPPTPGGSTTGNSTDERLAGLRRRVETDTKGLTLLRPRDMAKTAPVLVKLENAIITYALEYYKAQSKRVKRYKKALNKTTHMALHVRHSFKIAHYYEFRRFTTKVLQNYEAAYRAVIALPLHEADKNDGIGFAQVKTMAEYINFKLCYHLLFSSSNIKGAVEQLQRHMKVYARAMGPVERAFEHWEWVSRQYHVFAQLLAEAVSIRGSLPAAGLEADAFKEPYLYFAIAAKYATYRRRAAEKLGLVDPEATGVSPSNLSDFVIVPSVYVGGDPVVSEATSPEPSYGAFVKYRYAIERTVPHARRAIHLLEQAIHHLSLYSSDQKVPRNRMKNRLLVQLGIERLASYDPERARAELQKAKTVCSGEQWWAQTGQILRHLVLCTHQQGDTLAFIDYNLQLLSPALEEHVQFVDRLKAQESFEQAWRDPVGLGAPFSPSSALAGYELALDQSRPLFEVHTHFDRVYACVREEVMLTVNVYSAFPSLLSISKLELLFDDSRYNMVINHRDDIDNVTFDDATHQWFASLVFNSAMCTQFRIPLRVLEGQNLLKYQRTKFHIGSGQRTLVDNSSSLKEQFLVLSLPNENGNTQLRRNARPYLADGRIPVMGRGPGSPSFARRKSMFSMVEVGRSGELDSGELTEEEASPDVRSSALAILQPRAKARIQLITKHTLLTGDYRVIVFNLKSSEDTLRSPSFRIISETSSPSSEPIFFLNSGDSSILNPLPLDSSGQPAERVPLCDLEPNSDQEFSVIARCVKAMTLRFGVNVAYCTKSGVQVSLDEWFELECKNPFSLKCGFTHDFPNNVGVSTGDANTKESYALVGKPVNLQGVVNCTAPEKVRILSMSLENGDGTIAKSLAASGFGQFNEGDECQVVNKGDSRGFYLRLHPMHAAPFVSLGHIKVHWRRLSSIVPTSVEHPNDVVTTILDIPTVSFIESPLTISFKTPAFGVEGNLFSLEIHLCNNENAIHSVRLKPFDETGDFMISGRTNIVEDLLPMESHVFRIGLVPTKSGYLRLPQVEITSVTYNMPFTNSNERHEVFVFPRECPQWKPEQVDGDHQTTVGQLVP